MISSKMSSSNTKRPSSARRNIKQETYSSFVSLTRLRAIQSLLSNFNGDSNEKADAILCILGVDSRYNDGCQQLADYLLFDFFESRKTEIERSGYDEDVIDDMIFLIRRDRVDVYCNPVNYLFLIPYISHWRNLRLHCMTDKDYEDDEEAEEFKIKSFINMTEGCNVVGIPFSGQGKSLPFDKMVVEKWPVVQAFALEGFGGGGFFTMKHEVTDMSRHIHDVYHTLDPVSVEHIVTELLPLFVRQWDNMMTAVDNSGKAGFIDLSEKAVSESLWSYFNHGRVSSAKSRQGSDGQHPFVLFGCHSNRQNLMKAEKGATLDDVIAGSSGSEHSPSLHMVCQSVSPRGPLSCTRTYFFGSGVKPYPVITETVEQEDEANDLRTLINIYTACTDAVKCAVEVFSHTLSQSKAVSEALKVLSTKCEAKCGSSIANHLKLKNNVEVRIEAHDNNNRLVELHEGHQSFLVKVVRVTVFDVPGRDGHSNLGSVSFGDSFLDSSIHVQNPDGSTSLDATSCVLTSRVPSFVQWPFQEVDSSREEEVKAMEGQEEHVFGKPLIKGEKALLASEATNETINNGQIYVYENGVIFTHRHLGPVILPRSQMESIYFYDGESSSEVALLVLFVLPSYSHFVPYHLRASIQRLVFGFTPKSKAYKALYSNVLPSWKLEEQEPCLEPVEELPDDLEELQTRLQQEYQSSLIPPGAGLKSLKALLPELNGLLEHFATSTALGNSLVMKKDLHATITGQSDAGSFDDTDELVLTILTGIPGSHKDTLCNILTKMSKEDNRWAVFRHPVDNTDQFSAASLQTNLAALLAKKRSKGSNSRKKMRAIIVSPGFTDTVDVVQAIVKHPNKGVAGHLKIGAVTACIDPANMYMSDRYVFPKLLDQCAQGWVNNIVFTGPSNDPRLTDVQQLIRGVNSDVALLLADQGEVTRSPDLELILSETAFSEGSLLRARYLTAPGWHHGSFIAGGSYPPLKEIFLRFRRPLDKTKLTSRLKDLKKINGPFPFTGNIYQVRGKVVFKGSDQLVDLRYSVENGSYQLSPSEKQLLPTENGAPTQLPSCCVALVGCGLEEQKLRDWLRSCAPQKPEKKPLLTRNKLTKAEIKKIHGAHHLEPLPEGWFYNGSRYVSLGGDKSDMHPCLENFLSTHVDKLNVEISDHNAKIEKMEYHDLFD